MAITTVNTDVAVELNITARRNDTFKLLLDVKDSDGVILPMDTLQLDAEGGSATTTPKYQAKMTITTSSGDAVLSLYSTFWNNVVQDINDTHDANVFPEPSTAGHYSGVSTTFALETSGNTCIFLAGQELGTPPTGQVSITVPYTYMDFQSGTYKYDLQISVLGIATDTAEYTTWLYGSFILNPDVTQI